MDDLLHQIEYNTYTMVSSYLKVYPTHSLLISYPAPIRVRLPGYELSDDSPEPLDPDLPRPPSPAALDESLRRTKTTISDLIVCNQFDLFCTFTFSPDSFNRLDPIACKNHMSKWLNRQRERNGHFSYLIVPEYHKKGGLHFHALIKDYTGKLSPAIAPSGKQRLQNGRKVYNITSYKLGFSTAVKIDDNIEKVGSYVKKYITKDMPVFSGKKRYWCSMGLARPLVFRNPEFDPWTLDEFVPLYEGDGFDISERRGIMPTQIFNGELPIWQISET